MNHPTPPYWFIVALAALVPLHRRILLRAHAGETYNEIGNALQLAPEIVRQHSHTALTSLELARP